jgi:ATP-binding cassette subfamily F protein uup
MVTHDRFFLDKIATALFVFEGDAVVHRHEGGFELYRRLRERRETEEANAKADAADAARANRKKGAGVASASGASSAADATASGAASARKKLSWKETRELEGLGDAIMEAETERDALSARLADPALYRDAAETARVTNAFNAAKANVDKLYARWAELEERSGA